MRTHESYSNGKNYRQRTFSAHDPRQNYIESGASLVPFQADQLQTRGTSQITAETVSAEEFPWRSLAEGGENSRLFPATVSEQQSRFKTKRITLFISMVIIARVGQGGTISSGYDNANANLEDWIEITFSPAR